ncbi:MAG: hypothetical protein GYB65_18940 [Chloroflexi bacterium]|nr:hypothetical protein [Chloroflexota bacterium]
MVLSPRLAGRLDEIARQENRTPEEVLESMLGQYQPALPVSRAQPDAGRGFSVQRAKQQVYARARAYWAEVGDAERLKLTDDQLDRRFWFFDEDGVPRLKTDSVTLPTPKGGGF